MNIRLLKEQIVKNGLTQEDIAKELGISETVFNKRLKRGEFGSEDAQQLIRLLEIDDPVPIFFNK